MGATILLTGASSFTGFWFARELAREGHRVIATLRRKPQDYEGTRGRRVALLMQCADVVPEIVFGDAAFLKLTETSRCDLLCHTAARMERYRDIDFNISLALAENTRNFKAVSEILAGNGARGVVIAGTVAEAGEGQGTMPLAAMSPYALAKSMTATVLDFWCQRASLPLGKFVIPNPVGPMDQDRFCEYLAGEWLAHRVPTVRTPRYVRDNIHVSLLARAFAAFCADMLEAPHDRKLGPSLYAESQGDFAHRLAREMSPRLGLPCPLELAEQPVLAEPEIRINRDKVRERFPDWSETAAWDEFAASLACRSEAAHVVG